MLTVLARANMHSDALIGPIRSVLNVLEEEEGRECQWNETIELAIPIADTNPSTCIVLNLVQRDKDDFVLAGTTLYIYEKVGKDWYLRQGHFKLRLWPGMAATFPEDRAACSTDCTPKYTSSDFKGWDKVERLLKEYEDGFVEPEIFHEKVDPQIVKKLQMEEADKSGTLYVFVKLSSFDHPIIYRDFTNLNEANMEKLYERPNPVVRYWKNYRKLFGEDPTKVEPTAHAYDYLMELTARPLSWRWTPENRALIWKYRYWLRKHENALPKFVQIIDWDDSNEIGMITDVLLTWSRPSIWTCLELMATYGPYQPEDIDLIWTCSFSRTFASEKIDDDLLLLLLPAILRYFHQICRFQSYYPLEDAQSVIEPKKAVNLLANFLLDQAIASNMFAQRLFWTLKLKSKEISTKSDDIDKRDNVFARLLGQLLHKLQNDKVSTDCVQILFKEEQLFTKICRYLRDSRLERMSRHQKIEFLKKFTADANNGILSFTSTPLPYDAIIKVTGTLPDKLNVYKSNVMPVKLVFVTNDIQEHSVIFKAGEDLRQDVLILNLLRFIDLIWIKNGLDLRLTPYRCISLSLTDGMLEFIPSEPLSHVIGTYSGGILAFLSAAASNPSLSSLTSTYNLVDSSTHNVTELTLTSTAMKFAQKLPEETMENFIRSCAGYCVFTFILGIGDRHLDNLLLTKDGRLFHIDFSYIFGRDPKPFPPPMKICREMVEAMGGPTGSFFNRFKSLCFAAFSLLRRHARIVVAYIDLCADETGVKYVHEKLMLEMDELDALMQFESLIDESIHALFPKLFETLHKWAQYWRH